MKPDHFSSQVHTFQARLWRTFPCLFLVPCLPMQEQDSTDPPCEAGPSLPQECSTGGREDAATSSPREDRFTLALDHRLLVSLLGHPQVVPAPRRKIPPSAWGTVLQRVEQGESLRRIARSYGVSY